MGYVSSRLFLITLYGVTLVSGLALPIIITIITMTGVVYGQSSTSTSIIDSSNLTVKVDKVLYESADIIEVTGQSSLNPANQNLEIQIINPNGAIYRTHNLAPSSAGHFEYQFRIGGKFAVAGVYTVAVSSADGQGVKTTFAFVPEGMVAEEFMIDGKSYHVRIIADEKPGWLEEISPDPQTTSLVLHLSNAESQVLSMELDHYVIATDFGECFIAQADGEPVDVRCSQVDGDTTLFTMTVPAQTNELQIVGTFLIPEFGTFLVPIVIIAFSVSILATPKLRLGK